ncbi:GFA family protein [Pseudomonas sp. CVAP|uniref:GFA family protein n=1 Tax=Pseudomonas sp. CVAP\|nr:GFA family protein [Pseudomonas sp. CVAP\
MATVSHAALKILRGQEWLSLYQWNTGKAEHYFCSKCGIYTFNRRRMDSDLYSVYAYCLDGLDLATLPVRQVAGKNRP